MKVTIFSHVHAAECFIPKISAHVLGDFFNLRHRISVGHFLTLPSSTFTASILFSLLLRNDASFPPEITRTSQTYRRQNRSACPAWCAFPSRRARLPWHAQKMCAVIIVGTVLNFPFVYCTWGSSSSYLSLRNLTVLQSSSKFATSLWSFKLILSVSPLTTSFIWSKVAILACSVEIWTSTNRRVRPP